MLEAQRGLRLRLLDHLVHQRALPLLLVSVGPVEDGPEETPVNGGLAHDQRVLLVETRVARDGHNGVLPRRELPEVKVLHGPGGHQRLLRVVQEVGEGVHALQEVGGVHSHGLLSHGALVRIPRTLVMIREGDDRRADSQYHRGVDLAVRVGFRVRPMLVVPCLLEVLDAHGDHRGLLLLAVDVLEEPVPNEALPRVVGDVIVLQGQDGVLVDVHALVLHDVQRSTAPPIVAHQPNLLELNVVDDADLVHDLPRPSQLPHRLHKDVRVVVDAHPSPIQEDLGVVLDHRGGHLLQGLHVPLVQEEGELLHLLLSRAHRDVSHKREVLHQPAGLALRGLGGADHPPVGVVQLARLGELPFPADRRIHPPQVRQRGRKGEPVQHLGDPRPHPLGALGAPISRGQRVPHPIRNRCGLEHDKDVVVPPVVNPLLHVLSELPDLLPEDQPEQARHERAGKVEPLVPVMVSVILLPAAKRHEQEPVHHVAHKVGLLRTVLPAHADVWQELPLQDVPGVLDPALAGHSDGEVTPLPNVVQGHLLVLNGVALVDRGLE